MNSIAHTALKTAAMGWCGAAVLGQFIFAAYVLVFYGGAATRGQFEAWNKVMPHGFVAGDRAGNAAVALHLFFTVLVVGGGALQLLPWLRRHAPQVHRWNGRVYLVGAMVLSVGGVFMLLTRGTVGGPLQHFALALNALLILAFAGLAWRNAVARRFDAHRRWALRLFLAVSGVWFFRIGLMAWLVINRAPLGFDPVTFRGPFLVFLAFAQYLLPLAVLELYFRAQQHGSPRVKMAFAAGLASLTLLMAVGIVSATLMMWLPRF